MAPASELRFLILGNSGDVVDLGLPFGTRAAALQQTVAELTGQPVRAQWAAVYPNPGLGRYVSRLLGEFRPDIVLLRCPGYAVAGTYLSASLESAFGGRLRPLVKCLVPRIGRFLDRAPGKDETGDEIHIRRALYYAGRNALLRVGLGRPFVSVEAAASAYESAITAIAASEQITLAVRGPNGQVLPHYPPRLRSVAVERIAALDERLRQLCAHRCVPFCSTLERTRDDLARYFLPDGFHTNAAGQALTIELETELLRPLLTEGSGSR